MLKIITLFVTLTSIATDTKWKKYSGAWFEIKYPSNFIVNNLEKKDKEGVKYDSVIFTSPDKKITFGVFSPLWGGDTVLTKIDKSEKITSRKIIEENIGNKEKHKKKTWLGVTPSDNSYTKYIYIEEKLGDSKTKHVFSIKCTDSATHKKYKKIYKSFKDSLIQFAD